MFDNLSDRLQKFIKNIKGQGKLTEKNIKESLREVRLALLEADVNYKVVRKFIKNIEQKAIGREVLESLSPSQQLIKVVNDSLIELMGESNVPLNQTTVPPNIILIAGLQGSGKTTFCAKLALHLRKKKQQNPLLVACDVYRPAAIDQLETLGKQNDIAVFSDRNNQNPVKIYKKGIDYGKQNGFDTIIIDTAGRLHIDDKLMAELRNMQKVVTSNELLLILDSMTGQDAVNIAKEFSETINITGVVLTKLDSDTRGGAALSVREVTQVPIKFISNGEKVSDLDIFYPDRIASRILGMGDVLSLIEKAEEVTDKKKAKELERKLRKAQFTFTDFLDQLKQIKRMGPLSNVLSMIPGFSKIKIPGLAEQSEEQFQKMEAIIFSMTTEERNRPKVLDIHRRRRIAKGSGVKIEEVNRLIKQFNQMQKMMKKMSKFGNKMGDLSSMFGM